MDFAFTFSLALLALVIEAVAGYSETLYRLIGHPVTWMGALIGWLDHWLNRESDEPETRLALGGVTLVIALAAAIGVSLYLVSLFPEGLIGTVVIAILASTLLAQRSLYRHVATVAKALDAGGVTAGRGAVAQIVGRDPEALDEAGVARAAIESLAENFSDAVIAPAFWIAIFGLAGGVAYKAANTADSMIGHRTPRYAEFGKAAARFDDLVNLPASRLSAAFLCLAGFFLPGASAAKALQAVSFDARRHRSPNAGWPEAAMAGALDLALAGPRRYHGVIVPDDWIGAGRARAEPADLRRALALFALACVLAAALMILAVGVLVQL